MNTFGELAAAFAALPLEVRDAIADALDGESPLIGAFSYQSEFAVCPVVAGAMARAIWRHGTLMPGNPAWGTADGPSSEVEEFAACFDLAAAVTSLDAAVAAVRGMCGYGSDCVVEKPPLDPLLPKEHFTDRLMADSRSAGSRPQNWYF